MGICEEVDKFRDAILSKIEVNLMPAEWELVLDLGDGEDPRELMCYYYFVNHSNRTLFWLHTFDVMPLLAGLDYVTSERRIRESEFLTPVFVPISDCRSQSKHWRAFTGKFVSENSLRGG